MSFSLQHIAFSNTIMLIRTVALFIVIELACVPASATALREDRPTDDSVCDLGHGTSAALRAIGFVPWDTRASDEVYTRMVVSWVAANCRDGQTLVIDASYGAETEKKYAATSALRLCRAADVKQAPKGTEEHPHAFELRCTISKLADAKSWSAAEDAKQSLESMILERSPSLRREGKPREQVKESPTDKSFDKTISKCAGKPTLATILFGGTCPKQ